MDEAPALQSIKSFKHNFIAENLHIKEKKMTRLTNVTHQPCFVTNCGSIIKISVTYILQWKPTITRIGRQMSLTWTGYVGG